MMMMMMMMMHLYRCMHFACFFCFLNCKTTRANVVFIVILYFFHHDLFYRCGQRDPNSVPGLKPGEMNLMFQRIVDTAPGNVTDATQLAAQEGRLQDDGTPIYTVTVHSRPETPTPTPDEDNDNAIILDKEKDAKESPWVITLDNFLTDQECQHLIDMGHRNGYERSTDVGHQQVDGSYSVLKSRSRTSENSWCNEKSGCRGDPMVSTIMERLGNVTGIPPNHYEDLQLLKVSRHFVRSRWKVCANCFIFQNLLNVLFCLCCEK